MASLSTSSPHAHKAHPFPPSDVMAIESDINGNSHSESLSLNQSAYQDNTLIDSSAPTVNGSSAPSASVDPTPATGEQPQAIVQSVIDTNSTPLTNLPATSTVPPNIEPPTSDEREGPASSSQMEDIRADASISQPGASAGEALPNTADEMDIVGTKNLTEVDNGQAMDNLDPSAPAASTEAPTQATPPQDAVVPVETTEIASRPKGGPDTTMTEAPEPENPGTATQVVASADMADNIGESGSAGKVRPREEDGEDGSPASKRTKLEENEDSTFEFKVPEVPQPATIAEEKKLQGAPASSESSASSASSAFAGPQADTGPITTAQQKSLAEILKNVRKVKDAKAFVDRVDPVKLNLPTYFEIIQTPMDLKTIESKLKSSEYKSVAELASDFDLMIQNSHTFNGAQHPVSVAGSNLQAYFRKALSKVPARDAPQPAPPEKKPKRPSVGARPVSEAPRRPSRVSGGNARSPPAEKSKDAFALGPDGTPVIRRDSTIGDRPKREIHRPAKDLPYASAKPRRKKFQQELRFVDHVVAEMNKQKYQGMSWPFAAPVDPVALNIPSYFSVIKKPMDFGTITQKSKTNQYENAKEFRGDVDLMFENCFKFNPTGDNINTLGKQFQDVFKRLWSEKDDWMADNAPTSGPQSPGMNSDSEDEDADDEEVDEEDEREAKLREIQQQIAALTQQAADVLKPPVKKPSPKAPSRKSSGKAAKPAGKGGRKSSGLSGPGAKAAPKPVKKPTKVKPLTQDEKAEIQEKVERLTDQQPDKAGDLVRIIKENDPKFANLAEDEIELELEELEVDVARMLLKYVRKFYPQTQVSAIADDDDFEPERRAAKNAAATSSRKKNKPMTKVQQETDMSAIRSKLNQYGNPNAPGEQSSDPQQQESSDDDDSGSESEEE
ncbi:MAG: hypothetical protein Q9165_006440 [Trypethelium subeluteriae]